jgi:NDP-sugar pyrophosphorylase family protein
MPGVQQQIGRAVILAGGPKPAPLAELARRSVLDLLLTPDSTALCCWIERIAALRAHLSDGFSVTVVHDARVPRPNEPPDAGFPISIEVEPSTYRGPAGVVLDMVADEPPEALVLIAEGHRYVAVDLEPMVLEHATRNADITVAANPDESPAGLYLVKRSTLDLVGEVGFMDLKEQWMRAAIDGGLSVWCHRLAAPGTLPIRTLEQLLSASGFAWSGLTGDRSAEGGAICRGSVVAKSAVLAPGAAVVDSIVMPDARIGAGSVVARSLVLPGAEVDPGSEVVDAAVTPRKL